MILKARFIEEHRLDDCAFAVVNATNVKFKDCRLRWKGITKQWGKSVEFRNCEACEIIGGNMPDCPPYNK